MSKLKCDPYDDPVLGDRLDDIDEKIEMLENASFPLLSPIECPISKSSYFKLIDNVCYYFEGQISLAYRDAQQNCKVIFGPQGCLFEPDTPEKSREIFTLARAITTANHWWVGIDSIGRNSKQWRYASSGKPLTMTTENYNNLNAGNYCTRLDNTGGTAHQYGCTNELYSICESKNVKQE